MNLGSLIGYLGLDTKDWDKGLDKAEGGIKDFAKRGAVLAAAAGVAIATAVTGAVVAGMNIEAANDKLAAQLGLSAAESERVGGVAGKLYANAYGDSIESVNGAVAAVMSSIGGMSSASSADLEAMTAKALDFATAFEVDVTRSTQIAGQMITQGLAKDGTEAFDLLVSASQQVPAAIREDLLDATDEYGGFFADLGYTGPQAMALLVDASEKGMYGLDKLGDAVKEFGIRATDMSTASAVGYDLMGMSQEDMTGKLLAGGETARSAFQEIIQGVQGIKDPVAQSQAALALFGTPLEDLSVQEIPAFLDALAMSKGELENVAGAADRMGDTLNDNAKTNLESFKRQAIGAFVDVLGGQVLPMVNSVASTLATQFGPAVKAVGGFLTGTLVPALQSAAKWMSEHQTVVKVAAGVIATLLLPTLVGLAVGYARAAAAAVVSAATQSAAWLATQVRALATGAVLAVYYALSIAGWIGMAVAATANAAIVVAGWVLMGAQSLIQAGRMAAAWLIAMGPVGWVIAAVVALVALIIANWDTIVSWTKKAWGWVVQAIGAAWEWIKGAVKAGIDFLVNLFLNFTGPGLIIKHWETIKNATVNAWNAVKSAVSGAWNAVVSAVSNGVSSAVNFVRELPGRILSALGNMGSLLLSAGADLIRGFINGIKNAFNSVKDTLGDLTSKLTSWKGPPARDKVLLRGAGQMIIAGFIGGMESQYGSARHSLARFTDDIAGMQPAVAAQMAAMANTQALSSLSVAGPSWAAGAGASQMGASGAAGGSPLFHADTVNVIEGTPQDIAQELVYQGRTRGW